VVPGVTLKKSATVTAGAVVVPKREGP